MQPEGVAALSLTSDFHLLGFRDVVENSVRVVEGKSRGGADSGAEQFNVIGLNPEDLLNPGLVIGKLVKLAPPFAKSPFLIVCSTDQFELAHPVLLLDKRQHSAIIADVEGGTN